MNSQILRALQESLASELAARITRCPTPPTTRRSSPRTSPSSTTASARRRSPRRSSSSSPAPPPCKALQERRRGLVLGTYHSFGESEHYSEGERSRRYQEVCGGAVRCRSELAARPDGADLSPRAERRGAAANRVDLLIQTNI